MTRNRSDRLKPVVKLAEHREKKSAKILGQSRSNHSAQKNQLKDLLEYRESYALMLQQKAQQGISSGDFCLYQNFLEQLDQAIIKQKQTLSESSETIKNSVKGWKNQHQKQQAMEKMTHKLKQQEHKIYEKKQQREADDAVNQKNSNTENLF